MEELGGEERAEVTCEVLEGDDGVATLRVAGELDISNIDELEAAAEPVLSRDPPRLVIDVAALRFADSSAIALWVRWAGRVPAIEVRDPSPLLRRVITAMGLDQTLPMTP